jgi:alcohol dehydrogenase (NADP+)
MSSADTFSGWVANDKHSIEGKLTWRIFTPKPFTPNNVEIGITHCSICGSDISTLRSAFGTTAYPCVAGHEIVGHVVRIGSKAQAERGFKVGDRVGVGAQSDSCLKPDCEFCADGDEPFSPHMVQTDRETYSDGSKSYGGYVEKIRVPGYSVVRIPDGLESADAAPMLCAGVTV